MAQAANSSTRNRPRTSAPFECGISRAPPLKISLNLTLCADGYKTPEPSQLRSGPIPCGSPRRAPTRRQRAASSGLIACAPTALKPYPVLLGLLGEEL